MERLVYRLETDQLTNASEHTGGFTKTARDLRVLAPPVWAVSVRRCKMPSGTHGDCTMLAKEGEAPRFIIRVDRKLDEETQVYVLLHEWAHALSWGSESHRIRNHGAEWGIAMSRIWQALVED